MVKPTVTSDFVGDVTFTFIIRMNGKTLGSRSRSSNLAFEGSVWQPGVAAFVGSEVRRPQGPSRRGHRDFRKEAGQVQR